MRLNPFDEALLIGFKPTLKRWIESIVLEGITPKFIHLDTHYMYDMVNDMVEILEVINKMESIFFCKMTKQALSLWSPPHTQQRRSL
jgi:hypothetical protein